MESPASATGGALLDCIAQFCRSTNMAESTFGRRAVNDGKFVARLRDGACITPESLVRINAFMGQFGASAPNAPPELKLLIRAAAPATGEPRVVESGSGDAGARSRNFRFFDNRQKYLLFVNTCGEKEVIARDRKSVV